MRRFASAIVTTPSKRPIRRPAFSRVVSCWLRAALTIGQNSLRVSRRDDRTTGYSTSLACPGAAAATARGSCKSNTKEPAMKLTPTQVERVLSQLEAKAIPDDHPGVPQLYDLFGDHTFFLDRKGLNIVEPAETAQAGVQVGRIVNLANWSDANLTKLATHDPEPTDTIVEFGSTH